MLIALDAFDNGGRRDEEPNGVVNDALIVEDGKGIDALGLVDAVLIERDIALLRVAKRTVGKTGQTK